MHRHVHSPFLKVEPQRLSHLLAHLRLLRRVPLRTPLQRSRDVVERRVCFNLLCNLFDHRGEARLDLVEDLRDARRLHARVEVVDGAVVEVHVRLRRLQDLLPQIYHRREMRRKRLEISLRARPHPRCIRLRLKQRSLRCQLRRHAAVTLKPLLCLPQICLLHSVQLSRPHPFDGGDQLSDFLINLRLVDHTGKRSLLIATRRLRALRHHGLLVPAQKAHRALEVGDLAEFAT
mmetsp:Transcript_40425/g.96129  ORF Transcript_40425/g.96129 Transcript_40425/m.96129 type:complete len:233 (-) Transcript_40425:263-961(-)